MYELHATENQPVDIDCTVENIAEPTLLAHFGLWRV